MMLLLLVGAAGFSGTDLVGRFNEWRATHGESYATAAEESAALASFVRDDAEHNLALSLRLGHHVRWAAATALQAPTNASAAIATPMENPTHYGDPKDGCRPDETQTRIQGVAGGLCTPRCTLFTPCPTDTPPGVTAQPQCALEDARSLQKYCALLCSTTLPILYQRGADAQCGEKASCKAVQAGVGLCTYDD